MVNKKKASQYDDYITNMILGVFGFAFVLIVGLMITYRGFTSLHMFKQTIGIVYIFSAIAAAVAVVCVICQYIAAKKGTISKYKIFNSKNLAIVSAASAACAFIAARYYVDGVKLLYIIVPVVAVLALIKLIFSTEFFVIACMTSAAGFLMWFMSRSHDPSGIFEMSLAQVTGSSIFYIAIVALLLLAAVAVLIAAASKNAGDIKIAGRACKILNTSANYPLLYLSIALTALSTIVAFVFGSSIAYYLIYVVFGYLFITAFYYTVKMM